MMKPKTKEVCPMTKEVCPMIYKEYRGHKLYDMVNKEMET